MLAASIFLRVRQMKVWRNAIALNYYRSIVIVVGLAVGHNFKSYCLPTDIHRMM